MPPFLFFSNIHGTAALVFSVQKNILDLFKINEPIIKLGHKYKCEISKAFNKNYTPIHHLISIANYVLTNSIDDRSSIVSWSGTTWDNQPLIIVRIFFFQFQRKHQPLGLISLNECYQHCDWCLRF